MTDIVLPNLTNWVKQRVTAMYTATSREAFQDAFNAFLAKDVNITVNGKHMTREKYMELLMGQKSLETGAEMQFFTTVTVPAGKDTEEVSMFVRYCEILRADVCMTGR